MGWILPPGGVPELAHTISRNLYGRAPRELTPSEQDVVVAWIAGRATVSEAEVRRDLLKDWTAANEDKGHALSAHAGGAPRASVAERTRSVETSALGARLSLLTPSTNVSSAKGPSTTSAMLQGPTGWSAGKPLTLWEGAREIPDRSTFDTLGKQGELPGLGPMREVKFIITGAASGKPELAFINTNAYEAHHAFARGALRASDSLEEFNGRAYFDAGRDVVCGSVVAVAAPGGASTYALQFLPTDPMTVELVAQAGRLVKERAPFLADRLVYHPVGQGQSDVAGVGREALAKAGVSVIETRELLAGVTFSPLNEGVGYGTLRVIDGSDPRPATARDVVIFSRLPNDLSHTAGVITLDPQTPLSHVNLKAKQNGTPNAYIRGADQLREVKSLIGSIVRFEVTKDGYTLRGATAEEARAHMEALRPQASTSPPRDLRTTAPMPLAGIGHQDLPAFGAKSVNAAELAKVLPPSQRMDGVAVPFAFYDDFMRETGLYDEAKRMMAEPRFANDETFRHAQLSRFRRKLRATPLPEALRVRVDGVEKSFPAGASLRLRSSTNNEDLAGFNGAGLYSSRTWDPHAAPAPQKASFSDVMKDVWSSLWSFRAFEEREFHRIDHFATAMGVLVHESYASQGAAGVAVTKNIYDASWPGVYVNVQPADDLVTNPEGGVVPEELLLRRDARTGRYEPQVLRRSSLKAGAVLSPKQQQELAGVLDDIQAHFRGVYGAQGDAAFAMDVEFIVDDGRIRVLQARPWVG